MSILKKTRSVRLVLTFWYTVVLLCAFAVFSGGVYTYLRHLLEATLEEDLTAEVDWISQLIDLEQVRFERGRSAQKLDEDLVARIKDHFNRDPRNYIVVLATTNATLLYEHHERGFAAAMPVVPANGRIAFSSINEKSSGTLRVAGASRGSFILHVAFPEQTIEEVLKHVLTIFGLLAPVVLLVSFAGGWFMSGLVLRPIRQIADQTSRITAHNLSERIPVRDVDDELGKLIKAVNYTLGRLEASFEQMKQFSMNVAHELRTPLTILRGESELALQRRMTAAEMQQLATLYLEEAIHMSRIVDDLLTLAKADAGQLTIERIPVVLESLMDDLYDDTLILSVKKELHVDLTANDPAVVLGDPSRLRQLFRALITNAIRYTDAGGSITISSKRNDSTVTVAIQDTGIGIPADSIDRVFERFYRVDSARTRNKGGSGLGLSIAKWIAESHGGTITVSSTESVGSTFSVTLPLAPPETQVRSHSVLHHESPVGD